MAVLYAIQSRLERNLPPIPQPGVNTIPHRKARNKLRRRNTHCFCRTNSLYPLAAATDRLKPKFPVVFTTRS
ncbi:hypothetical protein CW304_13275 [Bacillus sp. UFRGS-B20]|nr:hypothetical protein CW304_13275 [Bacillus sp. UFRGS-B20]